MSQQNVEIVKRGIDAFNHRSCLLGSSSNVEMRFASVNEWRAGMMARVTTFLDIDEARAAGERLVEERA